MPGSSFGKPSIGMDDKRLNTPTQRNPIHHAPYQRESDGPFMPNLKNILKVLMVKKIDQNIS